MADKQKEELPKVPPFHIIGASGKEVEPSTEPSPPARNNAHLYHPGIFSTVILLISTISLGIAMISGAWFAYGILGPESAGEDKAPTQQAVQSQENTQSDAIGSENNTQEKANAREGVLSKVIVVGLAYIVGWILSIFGVRTFGNLILPFVIEVYAWVVLGGIVILQVLIVLRLYHQGYLISSYVKYLSLFGAGLFALVGLHLILEKHSLIPFGAFIFLTSLLHLYAIVYHYIFVPDVVHEKLWGDIIFFFVTTFVSILMMAHFGLLNGIRRLIDRMFSPKNNHFVPLE